MNELITYGNRADWSWHSYDSDKTPITNRWSTVYWRNLKCKQTLCQQNVRGSCIVAHFAIWYDDKNCSVHNSLICIQAYEAEWLFVISYCHCAHRTAYAIEFRVTQRESILEMEFIDNGPDVDSQSYALQVTAQCFYQFDAWVGVCGRGEVVVVLGIKRFSLILIFTWNDRNCLRCQCGGSLVVSDWPRPALVVISTVSLD